jgi:TetR/AcrR family transcriptional regulator, tetracycline repressor protein
MGNDQARTTAAARAGRGDDDGAAPGRARGRPPVPTERIVEAALQIVDDEGAGALSLRALAQRLGSSTATLYRHFDNRDELLNHVVDHTFSGAPTQAGELQGREWEDACRAMATSMFESLRKHPNVTALLLARAPTGPNAVALRELALQMLLNAGFSPSVAVRSYATLARFVLGFALQLTGEQADDVTTAGASRGSAEHGLPGTATVAEVAPLDEQFAFGLDLLLTGIAHRRSS